jgi:YHS domain-containing protein
MAWTNLGGLAWLLAGGALFYWMMRKGGCGMHAGHVHSPGHQHGGDGERADARTGQPSAEGEHDPVCGMPVDLARAAATRSVMGRTFYLCSNDCLAKFDRDPLTYAKRAMEAMPPETAKRSERHAHHHGGC